MDKWEQRGNHYYLRDRGWEYRILKTDIGWQQYEKRVEDDRWDLICTCSDLQQCMETR